MAGQMSLTVLFTTLGNNLLSNINPDLKPPPPPESCKRARKTSRPVDELHVREESLSALRKSNTTSAYSPFESPRKSLCNS